MAASETSIPGRAPDFERLDDSRPVDDGSASELSAADTEIKPKLKAEIGSLVTIQFLDNNAVSQFLITREEREINELPIDLQKQLPSDVKLARAATPIARLLLGKTASDDTLELIVQKTRPLKVLNIEII
jgi:hypothetical protein